MGPQCLSNIICFGPGDQIYINMLRPSRPLKKHIASIGYPLSTLLTAHEQACETTHAISLDTDLMNSPAVGMIACCIIFNDYSQHRVIVL